MTKQFISAALAAIVPLLCATNLSAQSSTIGFNGADLTFGTVSGGDTTTAALDGALDFAITAQHGLQLDVGAINYGEHWFGNVAGHLYMLPTERSKYGLFYAYSDADGSEASTMEAGVEGLWRLTDNINFGMRAGIGMADPSEVDYIFANVTTRVAISDQTSLYAGAHILEADERASSFTTTELEMGVNYAVPSIPVELYAGINQLNIKGTLDTKETRISLGLNTYIGAPRSARTPVSQQKFAPVRPLRDLIARDLIWGGMATR